MDFFDLKKPFMRIQLKGGQTQGFIKSNYVDYVKKEKIIPEEKEESHMEEKKELIKFSKMKEEDEETMKDLEDDSNCSGLTSVGTFPDISEIDDEKTTKIYAQYIKQDHSSANNLIINNFKSKILSMIELNEVTIISGPTGCGKTTQVPQYILDSYAKKNKFCNIIVCQPRRIAAITVAKRICEERNWPLGSICGYKIGLVNCMSKDTRLIYVTVGVLLQILLSKKHMNDYTHMILDEIHERDQLTDFALLIIKRCLQWNSRNVKVILMSATADATKFANYFAKQLYEELQPAPVIAITQAKKYLVQVHYLEELSPLGELPVIDFDNPQISQLHVKVGIKLIKQFEKLDSCESDKKSVLVFLPGISEIEEFYDKLKDPNIYISEETEYKWFPVPLHSSITIEEQAQAFRPAPTGYRKIILATNIAESSITVPDVMFVIDYCLTKILVTDPETNFTCLQLCWASKANLTQREGRTGRVMGGRVYRIIYKDIYDNLGEYCIPGMLRCPLEKVVLQSKLLDLGPPKAVLALAIDPPDLSNISKTILILKEVGGLLRTSKGVLSRVDGDLTFIGHLMAVLPVDIYITKLIALGYVYNCLEESIIIGAAMSLNCMFSNPFQAKLKSFNCKLDWANGSCSDCIAFLNVYDVWRMNHARGYYKRSNCKGEISWAKRHFIQLRTLKEIQILLEDIKCRLKNYGIESSTMRCSSNIWNELEKALVLKFIIAGAFYPNYFTRGAIGGQVNEREALKILGGKDPFSTVYLQNYPINQPPHLYSHLIREKMKECKEEMEISYDHGKVFIEFRERESSEKESKLLSNEKVSGQISMAVYRAVKMRETIKNFEIEMFPLEEARTKANLLRRQKNQGQTWRQETEIENQDGRFRSVLPEIESGLLSMNITHIVNPGDFWATLKNSDTLKRERDIFKWLNGPDADVEPFPDLPEVGDECAAPYKFESEIRLCRARIIDFCKNSKDEDMAEVFFIDFGNSETIPANCLRKYGSKSFELIGSEPGLAFRCTLSNIAPSRKKNHRGIWCEEAKKKFVQLVQGEELIGSICSVVDEVASLILYKIRPKNKFFFHRTINLNEILVEEGYAEMRNELEKKKISDFSQKPVYESIKETEEIRPKSPPIHSSSRKIPVNLRGPFSPLEMSIFSCTRGGASKTVKISSSSVNSILLDSDPGDPHERLVVAARVSQNRSGTTLILHNTTVMPNIHGLAALVPLVFAPTIELRVNEKRTAYTGFVCGLGVDEFGQSLFPERDMEVVFDCEFTPEDLATVNRLRFFTGNLLDGNGGFPPEIRFGYSIRGHPEVASFRAKIRECFLELTEKRRKPKEMEFPEKEFQWNLEESDLVVRNEKILSKSQISIFPLHPAVRIDSQSEDNRRLLAHLRDLRDLAESRTKNSKSKIDCKICQLTLLNEKFLRLHLVSESHKRKEEKFLISVDRSLNR